MNITPYLGRRASTTEECKAILAEAFSPSQNWKRVRKETRGNLTLRRFTGDYTRPPTRAFMPITAVITTDAAGNLANLEETTYELPRKAATPANVSTNYIKDMSAWQLYQHLLDSQREIDGFEDDTPTFHPDCDSWDRPKNSAGNVVEFSTENWEIDSGYCGCCLVGLHTIHDFTFMGVTAGGDWEYPLFYIVYCDNTGRIKQYVPTEGNTYNTETNYAYGNGGAIGSDYGDEVDDRNFRARHGKSYNDERGSSDVNINDIAILEDIKAHFGLPADARPCKHPIRQTQEN